MTLAEIVAEARRLEADVAAQKNFTARLFAEGNLNVHYMRHFPRLLAIAEAAVALFRALDYVTPGWRDDTCVITEDGDEVNVAWCGLENALENPNAGKPPEAF